MTCDQVRDLAAGFVLGALEPHDERAVRDHLAECPELHAELAELGSVLPYLDESVEQVAPRPELRARVLAAAAADVAADRSGGDPLPRGSVAGPGPVAPPPVSLEAVRAERTRRMTPRLSWLAGIAAVLAIAVLAAWNVSLQGELQTTRSYEQGVAAVLDVAARAGSQTAVLAPPAAGGPRGLAAVGPDGSVVMAMRDLPATSGSEVYEAWVILPGQDPLAIGGFTAGSAGTATFQSGATPARGGATLALTKEPAPGATKPSGTPVAAGIATAPPQS